MDDAVASDFFLLDCPLAILWNLNWEAVAAAVAIAVKQ